MLKIDILSKKCSFKISLKFYNIFMYKNYFIILVLILFTNNSFACDALKLTGTSVSKAQNTFFIIDGYSEEDFDEWATVQYVGYTADYCPKSNLENTYINVFVHKSKVVGIRVETMDVGVKENEIYEFANNTYGNLSQKMKSKTWFGYKDISVGQDKILYAKQKEFNGTIETLDISTEELIDFTVGEDVILAVN
tara:strand:- start:850 stop:1431 length:582 start_codon:yes stop_codon:yes gene_type:complete